GGQSLSPLYSDLTVKAQQLQTIQTLQGANASVIKTAETAPQVSPQPRRNAFIGLGLGIILGIVLAFIVEALDTRIRSTDAFARPGRHVLLVDLDLRRPTIDKFFDLRGMPGVVDVLDGDVSLDDVIAEHPTEDSPDIRGSLHVLPAGRVSSEAGELLLTRGLNNLLDQLAKQADIVLIDSPPMLHVGDAPGPPARVDA